MANGTERTTDFASLKLTIDRVRVAPGDTFNLTVAVTLKPGEDLYQPEVIYKLFVRLSQGLKAQSVKLASNKVNIASEAAWTGAPGKYGDVDLSWEMGPGERAKEAYQGWLLATWKSSHSAFEHLHPNGLGWTIELLMDANHDNAPANLDATLYAMQGDDEKSPLAIPLSIEIAIAAPAFASITFPEAVTSSGHIVLGATGAPIAVHATLAKAATATKMKIRWQVEGAGTSWNLAEPHEVDVVNGSDHTLLADFTIQHDFSQRETLLFSAAVAGQTEDRWGVPYKVTIDFVTGQLVVEEPVIKADASKSKITLTCKVRAPSALMAFTQLSISFDGGAHWNDITAKSSQAGSSPLYTFSYDIPERDFSQGVLLLAQDNLHLTKLPSPVKFAADSFLTAIWDGAPVKNNDINLGEAFAYSVSVQCALNSVLPPATIDLLLPDAAIKANTAQASFYFIQGLPQESGVRLASDWRGTRAESHFYIGPIHSGIVHAECHVRSESALLGQTLPAATLTINSRDFVTPFSSTGNAKAVVWKPAPTFVITWPVSLKMLTNQNAVDIVAVFTPPLDAVADLTFAVTVDTDTTRTVTPVAESLTRYGFSLHLDPSMFTAFSKDGTHSVQLSVHHSADSRAALRSTHSETLHIEINNARPAVQFPKVEVVGDKLRVSGKALDPLGASDPVTKAEIYWDSTTTTTPQPLTLTAEAGPPKRWAFAGEMEISKFTGKTLSPQLKIVTTGTTSNPLFEDLRFASAEGLFRIELKLLAGSDTGNIDSQGQLVSNHTSPGIKAGIISFKITVTSLVGMQQLLDMHVMTGEAFSSRYANSPTTSESFKLTSKAALWNLGGATLLLQTQNLEKGNSLSVTGTVVLVKLSEADLESFRTQNPDITLESAQTIAIAFTEPDSTPHTFRALKATEGVIFTAHLIAQS